MQEQEIKEKETGERIRLMMKLKKMLGRLYTYVEVRKYIENYIFGNAIEGFNSILDKNLDGKTIVDLGSGSGYYCLNLIEKNNVDRCICVDLSQKSLDKIKNKVEKIKKKVNVEYVRTDILKSGLQADTADLIVCNTLLHEFSRPELVINEMKRIVKEDGEIIIVDFLKEKRRGAFAGSGYMRDAHGAFENGELEKMMKSCGIKKVTSIKRNCWVICKGNK